MGAVIHSEIHGEIERAQAAGKQVRLHTRDGEVVVAEVLELDAEAVVYAPLTSSRPERYAVCDSTGFRLELASIERAVQVAARRTARRAPGA